MRSIQKPAGERCIKAKVGHGCAIYHDRLYACPDLVVSLAVRPEDGRHAVNLARAAKGP